MPVHALLHGSLRKSSMTSTPSPPPFRADHVGSLLRPPELLAARGQYRAGTLSAAQLKKQEDEAILAVVRHQEDLGLRAATDGEYRRTLWHIDFLKQFTNVEVIRSPIKL